MNFFKAVKLKRFFRKLIAFILIYVMLYGIQCESFVPISYAADEQKELTEVTWYRWKRYSKLSEVQDYLEKVDARDESIKTEFFEEGFFETGAPVMEGDVTTIIKASLPIVGLFLTIFGPGSKEFSNTDSPWSRVLITWDNQYFLSGDSWDGENIIGTSGSSRADYGVDLSKTTFDTVNPVGCWYIRKAGYDKDNGNAITVQIATGEQKGLFLVMDSYVVYEEWYLDNDYEGKDYADDAPYLSDCNNGIQFCYNIANRHDSYLKHSGNKVFESNDNGGNANSFKFYFCCPYTVSVYTLGYHIVEGATTVWTDRQCDCIVRVDGVLIIKGHVQNDGIFIVGPNGALIIDTGGCIDGSAVFSSGGWSKDYKVTISGNDVTYKVPRQSLVCDGVMVVSEGAGYYTPPTGYGQTVIKGNGALFVNGTLIVQSLIFDDYSTFTLGANAKVGVGVKLSGDMKGNLNLSYDDLARKLSKVGDSYQIESDLSNGKALFGTAVPIENILWSSWTANQPWNEYRDVMKCYRSYLSTSKYPTCVYPESKSWNSFFYLTNVVKTNMQTDGFMLWPTAGNTGVHTIN